MTQVSETIGFILVAPLAETIFNPHRPEGLKFQLSDGMHLTIKSDAEGGSPTKPPICKITSTFAATKPQADFVRELTVERRIVPHAGMPISLPYRLGERTLIDENGRFQEDFMPFFELYPVDVQRVCEQQRRSLGQAALRFIRLLRWSQGFDGPYDPFAWDGSLYWKVDGDVYYAVPEPERTATVASPVGITFDDDDQRTIQLLWNEQTVDEPLAHELVREAFELLRTSPRSAILVAVTALETGLKNHVARHVPKTDWLMENVPSPPVGKIVRKYIPILHQPLKKLDWAKLSPLFKAIDVLVETRNKLTHTGRMVDASFDVREAVSQVRDVLYVLDVLDGRDWAKELVSPETRKRLGWPAPRHQRYQVTISGPFKASRMGTKQSKKRA